MPASRPCLPASFTRTHRSVARASRYSVPAWKIGLAARVEVAERDEVVQQAVQVAVAAREALHLADGVDLRRHGEVVGDGLLERGLACRRPRIARTRATPSPSTVAPALRRRPRAVGARSARAEPVPLGLGERRLVLAQERRDHLRAQRVDARPASAGLTPRARGSGLAGLDEGEGELQHLLRGHREVLRGGLEVGLLAAVHRGLRARVERRQPAAQEEVVDLGPHAPARRARRAVRVAQRQQVLRGRPRPCFLQASKAAQSAKNAVEPRRVEARLAAAVGRAALRWPRPPRRPCAPRRPRRCPGARRRRR